MVQKVGSSGLAYSYEGLSAVRAETEVQCDAEQGTFALAPAGINDLIH